MFKHVKFTQLSGFVLSVLLMSWALAACTPSAASGPAANRPAAGNAASVGAGASVVNVKLTGTLDSVSPEAVVVNGTPFALAANAQVAAGLQPGAVVEVQSVKDASGALIAMAVQITEPVSQTTGMTFELVGPVESQSTSAWVIGGQAVQVSATTEIEGHPGIGDSVKAEGTLGAGGALLAREIKLVTGEPRPTPDGTPANEIEFTGVVVSIGADQWVIGDWTVLITTTTEIKSGAVVGALVKVHARTQADGSLLAREIEPTDDTGEGEPTETAEPRETPQATETHEGHEVEFRGLLSAITGDVWTIGGMEVQVTNDTEIKGDPQIGDVVRVHARRQADGTLVARKIEVKKAEATHTPKPEDTREATRTPEPSRTPEPTETHEAEHTPEPEETHEAEHTPQPTHEAEHTPEPTHTQQPNDGVSIEFTGQLTAQDGSNWTIGGTVYNVAGAEIRDNPQVGDMVKVHARQFPDGTVIVREVRKQ